MTASSQALNSVPLKYPRQFVFFPANCVPHGHLAQLRAIVTDVSDLVRHDQMVFGIDRRLHVLAHQARALGL